VSSSIDDAHWILGSVLIGLAGGLAILLAVVILTLRSRRRPRHGWARSSSMVPDYVQQSRPAGADDAVALWNATVPAGTVVQFRRYSAVRMRTAGPAWNAGGVPHVNVIGSPQAGPIPVPLNELILPAGRARR